MKKRALPIFNLDDPPLWFKDEREFYLSHMCRSYMLAVQQHVQEMSDEELATVTLEASGAVDFLLSVYLMVDIDLFRDELADEVDYRLAHKQKAARAAKRRKA